MKLISHHVLIWVSDMERAVRFYTETLGLPLKSKSPTFSVVAGDKFWISLHLSDKPVTVEERRKMQGPIVNFRPGDETEDVDTAYGELKNQGVEFCQEPFWAAPNVRVAEFYDSEGNKFSLSSAD